MRAIQWSQRMGTKKLECGLVEIIATKPIEWRIILLRLVALFATLSATLVMVLSQESKPLSPQFSDDSDGYLFEQVRFQRAPCCPYSCSEMLNVELMSTGENTAAFMVKLTKNGNTPTRWNEICSNFETFCDYTVGALISSFIGLGFMVVITIFSILSLHKPLLVADRPIVPHV
ncbi:Casparian strip membrane protein domain [Dillenia turbinata]|uniref:CASP-like protein n=1 Tax=Dillenia turbinata TaxID=194707 RepID=A0AAN8ZBG3_9MAGN